MLSINFVRGAKPYFEAVSVGDSQIELYPECASSNKIKNMKRIYNISCIFYFIYLSTL